MSSDILSSLTVPGLEQLFETAPGKATAVAGVNQTLAAVIACLTAKQGKKTLLVADNDLKAARAADDIRQLTGEGCCLPGGEIDLQPAASKAAGAGWKPWLR